MDLRSVDLLARFDLMGSYDDQMQPCCAGCHLEPAMRRTLAAPSGLDRGA
jgi:hypothetical protein